MLAYVCDFCGKVLSKESHRINREENPYFAVITIAFESSEKQYHCCKECFENSTKGTAVLNEIESKYMGE